MDEERPLIGRLTPSEIDLLIQLKGGNYKMYNHKMHEHREHEMREHKHGGCKFKLTETNFGLHNAPEVSLFKVVDLENPKPKLKP